MDINFWLVMEENISNEIQRFLSLQIKYIGVGTIRELVLKNPLTMESKTI